MIWNTNYCSKIKIFRFQMWIAEGWVLVTALWELNYYNNGQRTLVFRNKLLDFFKNGTFIGARRKRRDQEVDDQGEGHSRAEALLPRIPTPCLGDEAFHQIPLENNPRTDPYKEGEATIGRTFSHKNKLLFPTCWNFLKETFQKFILWFYTILISDISLCVSFRKFI